MRERNIAGPGWQKSKTIAHVKQGIIMSEQIEMGVRAVEAFNKDCAGCKNHESEIMILAEQARKWLGDPTIKVHLFLSQKQAMKLVDSLQKAINHNNSFTATPVG